MDAEFPELPIVPHEVAGVDCCGCITAEVNGDDVELRCNECGALVGTVQIDIFRGLLGLDGAKAECPHCGEINRFPGFPEMVTYTCKADNILYRALAAFAAVLACAARSFARAVRTALGLLALPRMPVISKTVFK